jgi:miniconductance mechanosensitive channel
LNYFNFISDIRTELSQYPWLEMLVALSILIFFAALANFIAKRIIVRGIRHLITKLKSPNQSIFAQHSITRRFANIVPAIVIMNGITTIPHLPAKVITFVQMGAQAFIFLTLALTVSEALNIFNLLYQRNPKSRNKPIKGYLQLIKLILFVVCGLMILGTLKKMYLLYWLDLVRWQQC